MSPSSALVASCLLGAAVLGAAALPAFPLYSDLRGQPYAVSYDGRSLMLNGSRILLLAGAIHYPRSTPQTWDDILGKAKADGLNSIQTCASADKITCGGGRRVVRASLPPVSPLTRRVPAPRQTSSGTRTSTSEASGTFPPSATSPSSWTRWVDPDGADEGARARVQPPSSAGHSRSLRSASPPLAAAAGRRARPLREPAPGPVRVRGVELVRRPAADVIRLRAGRGRGGCVRDDA